MSTTRGLLVTLALAVLLAAPPRVEAVTTWKVKLISLSRSRFVPAWSSVRPNTLVRWVNRDRAQHVIVPTGDTWEGHLTYRGAIYERLYVEPGIYAYRCTLFPGMYGWIEVRQLSR